MSTVREVGALPDFDDIAVGIADVAAYLAVLLYRLGNELGSSTFPQFIARLNIRNTNIHKAADFIRVGEGAQRYRRLIRGGPAAEVHNEPRIRDLEVPGPALAVAAAQNAAAEDLFIEIIRSIDVGDGNKECDGEPVARGHLIALLFDLYAVH